MNIDKLPLFKAMTRHMTWLNQRQTVLARNVANLDTPGYRPKDVPRPDFSQLVNRTSAALKPVATNESHIQGVRPQGPFRAEETKSRDSVSLSGNAVTLEDQLLKVSETAMEYEASTTLYNKHASMIRQALGRQR
ncbi:MAG: flagellar basal body protein [Alphaproteobacteria bacterium]|jgi:flagellar basal-body rod protein FlgB